MNHDVALATSTSSKAASVRDSPNTDDAGDRVQRNGYWQETRLTADGKTEELVIYSALPAIVLAASPVSRKDTIVVTIDPSKHLVVHADVVGVMGPLALPGRNVTIVARTLRFLELDATPSGIDTSGKSGDLPLDVTAKGPPAKPPKATDGSVTFTNLFEPHTVNGQPGTPGGSTSDGAAADGAHGKPGQAAGNISIFVDAIEGTGFLTAHGGAGHAAQEGQGGQAGGDGGDGDVEYTRGGSGPSIPITADPGPGGAGGNSGRGGAGGSGGDAGLISVSSVKPIPDTLEIDARPGLAGANGADGAPGAGGFSGRPAETKSSRDLGLPVTLQITCAASPIQHGATIGLKTLEKDVGSKNTFGVYDGAEHAVYYWTEGYDPNEQGWRVELVTPRADTTIRYGDVVRLTNLYRTGQRLVANDEYLGTDAGRDAHWVLREPSGHRAGTPIQTGAPLYLEDANGARITDAYSGTSFWFPRLARPRVQQASAGQVHDKPAGIDPWKDRKDGDPKTPVRKTFTRAELAAEWSPTQAWLEVERLNALVLTIALSGTDDDAFLEMLADWLEIFGARKDVAFASINASVQRMSGNLAQGLDVFAHPSDFAPNLSFVYYQRALDAAIADFAKLEKERGKLLSTVAQDDASRREATIAFNDATVRRAVAKEQLDDASRTFESAAEELEEASKQVVMLKPTLDRKTPHVAAFAEEVKSKFNACDLDKILDGLGMLAFCPPVSHEGEGGGGMSGSGALMAATQFAAYLEHGVDTIKTAYGKTLEKGQIINEAKRLGDDLFASAQEIYSEPSGVRCDVGSKAILATLDQWDELVAQFAQLDSAAPLLADIHALADAVRARGSALLAFNVALGDVIDLTNTLAETDAVIAAAQEAVAKGNAPDLGAQLSFLARQYQEQKNAIIELVYMANRAYAYWRLDDASSGDARNVFRSVMKAGEQGVYAAIDARVLASCQTKLDSWFRNDLSSASGAPTIFPTLPRSNGFQVFVDDKKRMDDLRQVRSIYQRDVHYLKLSISADGKNGSFTNPHLGRLCDVRLKTIRAFLNGAHREATATSDSLISVEILHDSRELNYTPKGHTRTYSRPALEPRLFVYDGARNAVRYKKNAPDAFADGFIHTDGDIGCGPLDTLAIEGDRPLYAGISPFGIWTIIIDPQSNPGLTFDDELTLEIQLLGSAHDRH